MNSPFKKIAFVGLGMMAGSFAKLIRDYSDTQLIYAVDISMETLEKAVLEGVLTKGYSTISELPQDLDLVIVATPISSINETLLRVSKHVLSPCVITDIASVKRGVGVALVLAPGQVFIGGHPMAGKTETGYVASEAALLKGATYLLTAPQGNETAEFQVFLESLGFNVLFLTPDIHDELLAGASHTPFVMAALTVLLAEEKAKDPLFNQIISSGFRDTTRVASGSPAWAADVLQNNTNAILSDLSALKRHIETLESLVRSGNRNALMDFFSHIKRVRDDLYNA